jgi:hypothetical protein
MYCTCSKLLKSYECFKNLVYNCKLKPFMKIIIYCEDK